MTLTKKCLSKKGTKDTIDIIVRSTIQLQLTAKQIGQRHKYKEHKKEKGTYGTYYKVEMQNADEHKIKNAEPNLQTTRPYIHISKKLLKRLIHFFDNKKYNRNVESPCKKKKKANTHFNSLTLIY